MPNKTKPPKPPEYPKGSPVTSDKRKKSSKRKTSSETPLLFKLFNLFKH